MREDEAGVRYLSALVKQDLAKLDGDGETRRLALKSLNHFVQQLDTSSVPKFITQIAESRESGGSRSYALSLYEEVARVHGKAIVPHIPRVMTSLIRGLSASWSSPQLQQSCAKVTASLARYTIDPTTSPGEAEEIIREICDPLAEALAGKLEPVAAGAAACIQSLAETEFWKYACNETVHEVCQRTTVALNEKSTRTAAHMQLVRVLASVNPDTLSIYGVSLLRAGEEIMKVTANAWQLRKAAAKMLQAVLTILDKETLEMELDSALHALDSCRLDRMPHVRAAVSEALHTAKLLASGDAIQPTVGMAASPIRRPPERGRSLWMNEIPVSPVSKRVASPRSQESHHLSFSPASTSTLEAVQVPSPTRSTGRRLKRAPLYPARGMGFAQSPRCRSTPGTSQTSSTSEECESPLHRLDTKENVPAGRTSINGVLLQEEELAQEEGNVKFSRPRAPVTSGAYTPHFPTQLDTCMMDVSKPASDAQDLKETVADLPFPDVISDSLAKSDADTGPANFSGNIEEVYPVRPALGNGVEVVLPRLRLGSPNNSESNSQQALATGHEISTSTSSNSARGGKQSVNGGQIWDVEVEKREIVTTAEGICTDEASSTTGQGSPEFLVGGRFSAKALSTQHYNALAHLDANPDKEGLNSLFKSIPFATPKRMMSAVQSNLASPMSRGSLLEQELPHNLDVVDGDVETSSEAGWSVRDNPIASEESFRADSSDEEMYERRRGHEAFSYPRKVSSADGVTPRDIHIVSPVYRKTRSVDGVDREGFEPTFIKSMVTTPRSVQAHNPEGSETSERTCSSCVSGVRAPSRVATDFKYKSVNHELSGLSSLLHEDDTAKKKKFCCSCEGSETGESADDVDVDSAMVKTNSARSGGNWWDRGLQKYLVTWMMSRNWRKICWYTEIVLGGSLCVVLALPLAMVVAKALNPPRSYHLVPT